MDIVYIQGLEVETVIGVYDWERKIRQTLTLDLEMASDIGSAAADDDIDKALDYKAVSDRLIEYIQSSRFELLESLVEQIADILMTEFAVPWVRIKLGKPGAVPAAKTVGVVIERGVKL